MDDDELQEWQAIYTELSNDNREEIWQAINQHLQSQTGHHTHPFTLTQRLRNIRLAIENFPPQIAFIQTIVLLILQKIQPVETAPLVWMASVYVLSFYIAAWLWYVMNRRFRPYAIKMTSS